MMAHGKTESRLTCAGQAAHLGADYSIGVGGYYITFNNSIDIPAWALYGAKETLPLTLEDFKKFTQKNMLDTTEVCNTLECSRQNISYMVKKRHILPIKESVRGNLYDKCEILRYKW